MGLGKLIKAFRRNQSGASAVEFAIVLPVLLATFAAMVESGRIYWNYQSAVSGVRDATRYLARIAPEDICAATAKAPTTIASTYKVGGKTFKTAATEIVLRAVSTDASLATPVTGQDASPKLPAYVSVPSDSVKVQYACIAGAYRTPTAPIVIVSANIVIQLPFGTLFDLLGDKPGTITSTVTDQSRIMGL